MNNNDQDTSYWEDFIDDAEEAFGIEKPNPNKTFPEIGFDDSDGDEPDFDDSEDILKILEIELLKAAHLNCLETKGRTHTDEERRHFEKVIRKMETELEGGNGEQ